MALKKLIFKPGINRDLTNYANEGGWYECDKIRFRQGFPEKIGGWTVKNFVQFEGTARSLYAYATTDQTENIGVGTNSKQYIASGTNIYDITPIRTNLTTTATDNCVDTTDTSNVVNINVVGHGCTDGAFVTISGVTGTVGGIPDSEINAEHEITFVDNDNFTITVTTAATSTVSGGGGTAINIQCQLNPGGASITFGYGWGTGTWGRSTWGSSSTVPVSLAPQLMFQDNFNNDLVYNIKNQDIFYWIYTSSFSNRAVLLSSLAGAVAVPKQVGKVMFAPSGHLLALACTGYDAGAGAPDYEGAYDALLVRWANVDADVGPEPEKWQPTVTNTAGFLRVKTGTGIVTALNARQETLIWTDTSLSSLQFLGTNEVFGLQEISNKVNIMSPNAAISVNNNVYWMGYDKFYVYDGRVNTLPCSLKQYIFEDINRNISQITFAGAIQEFNEVIWFYASATSNEINRYVIFNYQENIWYYGQLERHAWLGVGTNRFPLATYNGYLYEHENGKDDGQPVGQAPQAITSFIQSADMAVEDGERFVLTKRVIPDVNFTNSETTNPVTGTALTPEVQMTVGVRNFPGAANSNNDAAGNTLTRDVVTSASIDQYTNQVYIRARGRQMNVKIESNDVGTQWQLGAIRVDFKPDGRRG